MTTRSGDETPHSTRRTPHFIAAFTLIEMLVVISIIGILAALILGVYPAAHEKSIRSRVKTEMAAIETVIEAYKEKKGFYPPGTNFARPTLYYELTGEAINDPDLQSYFGVVQTVNSGAEDSYNFFKNVRISQLVTNLANNAKPAILLSVRTLAADGSPSAIWNYNPGSPGMPERHNHESFDLWVDVKIGGKTNTIGNWND